MYDVDEQAQALLALRDLGAEGQNVCVAVIDGAVDPNHPDIEAQQLETAQNAPATLHGTAVSALIVSPRTGIAPRVKLKQIPVFVEDAQGTLQGCSQLTLARAIRAAVEAKAQVINISGANLSNTGLAGDELREAVERCAKENVQIVAAVGNDGLASDTVPAAMDDVLAVGAHDINGLAAAFNNRGPILRRKMILAPGVDLLFQNETEQSHLTGSSFAAPIVTGLVALIRAAAPDIPIAELQSLINSSCVPCGDSPDRTDKTETAKRLDLVQLHEALTQLGSKLITPQRHILERKFPMSDSEKHTMIAPAGELTPPPSDIGDVTPAEATPAPEAEVSPAEVTPAEVAPAEAAEETTVALHSGSGPAPVSPPGHFMHLNQPTSVRPQHYDNNLQADNKVFAFGTIGYDFLTETNRDYFVQAMSSLSASNENFRGMHPVEEPAMVRFLTLQDPNTGRDNMDKATALTWVLKVDGIPIYAIRPQNQFAIMEFGQLVNFLIGQSGVSEEQYRDPNLSMGELMKACAAEAETPANKTVDRVSIAGHIVDEIRLYNGHVVPVLSPILRGMFSWNTKALSDGVMKSLKGRSKEEKDKAKDGLENFLSRVYYDLRNRGVEPYHRAMNFAATNAQQAGEVFLDAYSQNLVLDTISVERSPISRPSSDFWDVIMSFFNPHARKEEARMMYRYTVDVAGLMPVNFGPLRKWRAY